MKTAAASISLAGSQLGAAWHVCAFFHNPDEEYRILLPFITEGFACGDRAFPVVDPTLREAHLRRLASASIDVAVAAPSGQFTLHCVYDLAKFGGAVVVDMLWTPPMVIIGGLLQENPFFVPPDEFLQQLRARRATRTT